MCSMLRPIVICLVSAIAAACAQHSVQERARYCSVRTHEPCLESVRTGNCQPCPDGVTEARP